MRAAACPEGHLATTQTGKPERSYTRILGPWQPLPRRHVGPAIRGRPGATPGPVGSARFARTWRRSDDRTRSTAPRGDHVAPGLGGSGPRKTPAWPGRDSGAPAAPVGAPPAGSAVFAESSAGVTRRGVRPSGSSERRLRWAIGIVGGVLVVVVAAMIGTANNGDRQPAGQATGTIGSPGACEQHGTWRPRGHGFRTCRGVVRVHLDDAGETRRI